jgi:hypothetical protein
MKRHRDRFSVVTIYHRLDCANVEVIAEIQQCTFGALSKSRETGHRELRRDDPLRRLNALR